MKVAPGRHICICMADMVYLFHYYCFGFDRGKEMTDRKPVNIIPDEGFRSVTILDQSLLPGRTEYIKIDEGRLPSVYSQPMPWLCSQSANQNRQSAAGSLN